MMGEEEHQFDPGDRVDRYTITRLLATGGMGEVYEAVHRFTKRPVALKCLQLQRAEKGDFKERMKVEAEVLCELDHPNIVKVYDADITDSGVVWMAMELLVGRTLRELIHRVGPLPITDALHYASEIADGVGAAHEILVVHRDLKPENVFITRRNEVKVLDLGTAKFYDKDLHSTAKMQILGTPYYMSPEHLLGERVDVRTDIYALGLILYEMVAGHHPFAAGSNENLPSRVEIGHLQIYAPVPPLPEIMPDTPPELWTILGRALAKDRTERPHSMAEFAGALRSLRRRLVDSVPNGIMVGAAPLRAAFELNERRDYSPATPTPRLHTEPMAPMDRVIAAVETLPRPAQHAYAPGGNLLVSPTATTESRITPGPMSSSPEALGMVLPSRRGRLLFGGTAGAVFAGLLIAFRMGHWEREAEANHATEETNAAEVRVGPLRTRTELAASEPARAIPEVIPANSPKGHSRPEGDSRAAGVAGESTSPPVATSTGALVRRTPGQPRTDAKTSRDSIVVPGEPAPERPHAAVSHPNAARSQDQKTTRPLDLLFGLEGESTQ